MNKEKPPEMDKYTFGNSQAAQNLMVDILRKPEYIKYSKRVARLLSKQNIILRTVQFIPKETIRKATLKMWHEHFVDLCVDLPEVVKTHTLCIETGWYRQLLKINIEDTLSIENNAELMASLEKNKQRVLTQQAKREIKEEIKKSLLTDEEILDAADKACNKAEKEGVCETGDSCMDCRLREEAVAQAYQDKVLKILEGDVKG